MEIHVCNTSREKPVTAFCDECLHVLLAHDASLVCTLCALEARQVAIEDQFMRALEALRSDWEGWRARNDHLIPRAIGAYQDWPTETRVLHAQGEGPLYSPNGPQTGLAPPLGLTSLLDRALEAVPQDAQPRRAEDVPG